MIHFEHNAVDNADAILEELGSINYLYSYYHSDKFFDLAHKDQNLYLKCVKDHVNGKFAYHFMKLTVHDNIDIAYLYQSIVQTHTITTIHRHSKSNF